MQTELENLKLVLTSPRPRAPDTVRNYLSISNNFLAWLGDRLPPDEMDLRRYFLKRREEGIGEGSLRTIYTALEKLYSANRWPWPLRSEDRPEAPTEANTPALTREEVEELVRKREQYSKGECFYLAIATIYGPRRIELARVKKRDIKDNTIQIHTAKKGEKRTHLIPDEIIPYIEAYQPKEHDVSSLSLMFKRIGRKGLGKDLPDYGWHSFRRTIDTLLPVALAKADKPQWYAGYFLRWSLRTIGVRFFGSPMVGAYTRAHILSADPFFIDREVFSVHPFLPLWKQATE